MTMTENNTEYYLIRERILGKNENGQYSLFKNGTWQPDTEHLIMDTLMGYDPYEEPDSPYGIGNTSIMEEIETISAEEAKAFLRRQKGRN